MEGALHGLATFAQSIEPGPDGFQVAAVHIEDRPRFPWRGLMLDACRHWMPVEVVKRNLDAMAAVKLNVFHWHLSEDQGFRVESRKYPRLHELGSNGDYYTQDQIRDVVAYARDRGIRVIPEFDMPGHTSAWFAGYPGTGQRARPFTIGTRYGVFDAAMDPTKRGDLRVSGRLHRRDGAAFPRPLLPHRRRRGERPAVESVRRRSGVRQGAQPGGHARHSGVLQPASPEDPGKVRQDHDRMGRDPEPGAAHRQR